LTKLDPRTRIRGPLKFSWRSGRGTRVTQTVLGLLGERTNPRGYCGGQPFLTALDGVVKAWGQAPQLCPESDR
jgi:hypothetical protein